MIIYGIVITKNTNDNFINLVIKNSSGTMYNVKTSKEIANSLKPNHVYEFIVEEQVGLRIKYILKEVNDVSLFNDLKRAKILADFMNHKDIKSEDIKNSLYNYINKITNVVLHDITKTLIDRHIVDFITYPGGTKIHHNFLGGLIYHTITMLELVEGIVKAYPFLNINYLYAGIILHDLGKTREFTDVQNPEFSLEGQMLGHLVIGALEVNEVAKELGYSDREETLILEHILISHHGQLQYGSAKKPLTAEALLIWFLDSIDSKFQVIGDELAKTNPGEFSESIPVLEKMRLYKPKEEKND